MSTKKHTPETAKTAETRDDTADKPVTELAHVDGKTSVETMKQMAGVSDKQYEPAANNDGEPSQQQKDAFEGLKEAKKDVQHPDRDKDVNPHVAGPGSDIG